MNQPIYLDAAAATPLHPKAREALIDALGRYGDPRALHAPGRAARAALELARSRVASAIGAEPDEIAFASGAPQANAMAILGNVAAGASGRVVTTMLEHPSVVESARATGLAVARVGCDKYARVDVDSFAAEVDGAILASVQHASQDVGSMNALAECAGLARGAGVTVHTDASQTVPLLTVDVRGLGVDLLTISGRQAYAIAGIAALFARRGISADPLLHGVARRDRKLIEPNIVGAVALGAALDAIRPEIPDLAARLWSLTGRLRAGLEESGAGIRVLGHPTQRVPHIVAWAVSGIDAETLLMSMEDQGIVAGTVPAEPLVRAGLAGAGDVIVRMGLTPETREVDVDRVVETVPRIVRNLRDMATRADAAFARFED